MSAGLVVFAFSLFVYVFGAVLYSRAALAESSPLRRLAFVGSMFIVIAIAASVVRDHRWVEVAFPIYVGCTIYGWMASSRDANRRGVRPTGIARAILK